MKIRTECFRRKKNTRSSDEDRKKKYVGDEGICQNCQCERFVVVYVAIGSRQREMVEAALAIASSSDV